jgi:hypothetical protein
MWREVTPTAENQPDGPGDREERRGIVTLGEVADGIVAGVEADVHMAVDHPGTRVAPGRSTTSAKRKGHAV